MGVCYAVIMGAVLNARVNAGDLEDKEYVERTLKRCEELVNQAQAKEASVLSRVDEILK